MEGFLHLVVLGNVISKFKKRLTARYAKAWDSIKSPLNLNSSIFLMIIFLLLINLFIFFIKAIYFLPPPQK